jgi:hypothetical protein
VNVFWIGVGVPETQIFSSASRSKASAVSTAMGVPLWGRVKSREENSAGAATLHGAATTDRS